MALFFFTIKEMCVWHGLWRFTPYALRDRLSAIRRSMYCGAGYVAHATYALRARLSAIRRAMGDRRHRQKRRASHDGCAASSDRAVPSKSYRE